jgi:Domain of unknown function (DUF4082)
VPETLFTSQVPSSNNNSDGTPGITPATTVVFAVSGTVPGVRFYATTTVSGVYTGGLWTVDSSDPGGGTLLQQKTLGVTPTGGAWNDIIFDTPIAVTAGVPYRVGVFSGAGRYVATLGFFSVAGLTNGNVSAPQHGTAVAGKTVSQGTFRIDASFGYPNTSGNGTSYFIDVLFNADGGEVDLAATLNATAGLTVGLTREAPLAASLSATAGLTAGLTKEAPLAATLNATAGLTATFARETRLTAGLSATGTLTASLAAETSLAASLSASAGMTAALTVPTVGPTDPIATPVALELLACFTEQLQTLPSPPKYIQLRVGQETGPLIGPGVDECCSGLAWVRVADVYPSWDSFPQADNTWLPCGPLAYAVVLEMGIAFCMPWSDSDGTFEDVNPPSTADWAAAFATQMRDQTIMRRTAACCFRPTQRRAVGGWTSLPVEGGCTGGKLTVTVSVMSPCSDC